LEPGESSREIERAGSQEGPVCSWSWVEVEGVALWEFFVQAEEEVRN
jgi:hypothetical protein